MAHDEPKQDEGRALGFERLVFFSDAVFAIAITILVLDLRPSDVLQNGFNFAPLVPKLTGFLVSFYVIGSFWVAHHDLFRHVRGYDNRLITANLWFLAGIVFLPFSTSVVVIARPEPGPVVLYALSLAYVGLAMVVLTLVARRPALQAPGETRGGTIEEVINTAAAPLVFLITAAAAAFDAQHALWLLLLLFPVSVAGRRIGRALRRRADGAAD